LFIEHSGGHELHDFISRGVNRSVRGAGDPARAETLFSRARQGAFDAFHQLFRFERLWEKVDGACLHCLRAHRDVAVGGYEYKLLLAAAFDQGFLKIDPVKLRHPHINDHARSSVMD
jgi:hypothetical protein